MRRWGNDMRIDVQREWVGRVFPLGGRCTVAGLVAIGMEGVTRGYVAVRRREPLKHEWKEGGRLMICSN